MKSTQKTYQSQTYKSTNHKVSSRTPLSINTSKYTTFKANESQNLGRNKNFGLVNKSVIESLNIERRNYIYVDNPPDTHKIFFDSNLRKYRTLSVGLKNSSYNEKTYNPNRNKVNSSDIRYNQTNLSTIRKATTNNSGNKYNQTLRCICGKDLMERSLNLDKMTDQRGNRTSNSVNQRNNMTQSSRDNKYQASSRNEALLAKEKQDQRIHSYTNKIEPRKDNTSKNINDMNKNMRVNTADSLNAQKNQGSRGNEQEKEKQSILNKMQREKEKEKNKYEFNIPRPTKEKAYQGDMINRKINNDVNANTNINKPFASLNNQANYTPIQINKSTDQNYNAKKEVGDLAQMDLEQFKKMQSPYKNEEIIKDENGEIVKRKEEKTIIILPGQTIEPKSIIETFEKPTLEVVQNEDGTSQSILRQTKITTNVENIPITNPNSSSKKGEGDLQLIKQIITHEYKTVSANKDETDKNEENKEKEKEKEGLNINLENNMNKENEENIDKSNEMKENDTTNKKLRYMDLVEDENAQKENIMKDNKNTEFESNKKPGNKMEAKEKEKSKNKDSILKSKNKNKAKNEQLNQNKKTDEEIDSKNKNIKSNLAEKQTMTKKEKEKEKSNDKSKDINLSKAKDKSLQGSLNKEINLDKNQGKEGEETNLRKSFRRNKKGEKGEKEKKDNKQSDKEGNIKIVFELYEKCFKLGNKPGSEKDIAKIVEILIILEEKEWKDILSKLLKAFPKSNDLNKKILDLIINKKDDKINKDKNKLKGKGSSNKLSEEKKIQKESRSKSQIKSSGLKNKLMLEEEDNIKGETDKKPKFLENGGKASLISNSNFAVNSVNVANIGNLNFDGLFLDISKYQNKEREKNPFEGPSTFYKFYKLRQSKIKKKIIDMTNEAKNN